MKMRALLRTLLLLAAAATACGAPQDRADSDERFRDELMALADALRRLLGNDELRRTLGARGVQRARSIYSQEGMATRTLNVYQSYVAGKRA